MIYRTEARATPINNLGIASLAIVLVASQGRAAETPPLVQSVKAAAEHLATATIAENYAAVIDGTLPELIERMGGRDKAISNARAATANAVSQGFKLRTIQVGQPSDPVITRSRVYVIVPLQVVLTSPAGRLSKCLAKNNLFNFGSS